MNIQALFCIVCGDKIYSRAVHDFRSCTCGNISVDGGRDYMKISQKTQDYLHCAVKLDVTEKVLYDDWNTNADKYGLIKSPVPFRENNKNVYSKKRRTDGTNRRKTRK